MKKSYQMRLQLNEHRTRAILNVLLAFGFNSGFYHDFHTPILKYAEFSSKWYNQTENVRTLLDS